MQQTVDNSWLKSQHQQTENNIPEIKPQSELNQSQPPSPPCHLSLNIFGIQLIIVRSEYLPSTTQTHLSRTLSSDAFVVFKQSRSEQTLYPYKQLSKSVPLSSQTEPLKLITTNIQGYPKLLLADLDLFRREQWPDQKRENFMMQKLLQTLFDHAKQLHLNSLTLPYLWTQFQQKPTRMLFKFIEKYLEIDLLLGKPAYFSKIVIVIPQHDLFRQVSALLIQRMIKISQND